MKIKIPNAEVQELLDGKSFAYPKYSTQIINLANSNAQGTRPKVVGQLSDLIQEFDGRTISEWSTWYLERYPNAIEDASKKIWDMIKALKKSINAIDQEIVKQWVEDLVIAKTFSGLKFQEAILKKVSTQKHSSYRLSKPNEESKGIDGFIGKMPVSIKPHTYKIKKGLREAIDVKIIYYEKKKDGIVVEFNF